MSSSDAGEDSRLQDRGSGGGAPAAGRNQPPLWRRHAPRAAARSRWLRAAAWVPVPLVATGIAILWAADLKSSHGSRSLLILLNTIFSTLVSFLVALLAGRSFLIRGAPGLLLLGCGVLIWGAAAVVSVAFGGTDPNLNVTIYNGCAWLAALCHLAGAILFTRRSRPRRTAGIWLAASYGAALGVVALTTRLAFAHWTPEFFVQGQGGTPVRQAVLASAIAMFLLTAVLLRAANRRSLSSFLHWYSLGLVLIASGLSGVMIQSSFGGALNWMGRAAQYLGGVYMLVAAVLSMRDSHGWGISLEAALTEARQQYDDLFDLAADGIVVHELSTGTGPWKLVRANPSMCALLGCTAQQMVALSFADIVAPEHREAVLHKLATLTRDGALRHECTLVGQDGRRIATEIQSRVFHDRGRPMALSVLRDITERRRFEEQLRERIEELQAVMDVAPAAIWVAHDPQCNDIVGNRTADEFYEADQGENVSANVTPARRFFRGGRELAAGELPMQEATARNADVRDAELEVLLPSGRTITMIGSGSPLRDSAGNVRGCVGAFLDITERKRAEQELRQREQRLRIATSAAALGVFEWNVKDDRAIWENDRMYEIFGRTREDGPVGCAEFLAKVILPEDAGAFEQALKDGMQPDSAFHCACRIRRKDTGEERWLEYSGDFDLAGDGSPLRLVGVVRDISERKIIEQELIRSREWLRVTLSSIGDGVVVTDTGGCLTFINPVAEDLTGWKAADALGQPLQAVFRVCRADSSVAAENLVQRVLREGGIVALTDHTLLLDRNGRAIPIEDSAAPILDAAGDVAGVVIVFHDVTEKQRAQRALRESEERLRTLGDNLPEGAIYRYSHAGDGQPRFDFISAGIERLTGVPAAEAMGDAAALHRTIVPEDIARLAAAEADSRDRLAPFEMELRQRHRITGELHWSLLRAVPRRAADGSTVWDGIQLDITERKQRDEKIEHYNGVLEARNTIFRNALTCETDEELGRTCLAVVERITGSPLSFIAEINARGALDCVAVGDAGRHAWQFQSGAGRPLPAALREICGRVLADGKIFCANDPACLGDGDPTSRANLTAFLGVPMKQGGKTVGVIAAANRAGGYRPLDLEALDDLAGAFMQALMQKRAERAARASEERLRQAQKMESIGLLAGGIAHDFNNLLVGIIGNASLAEDLLPYGSPAADMLKQIIRAGEHAAHLTRQMLAYAGKGRFIVASVNLSSIVADTSSLVRASISKKITVNLSLDPHMSAIESDPSQMQQVFLNLALNAGEAIGSATGVISVATGEMDVDEACIERELADWPVEPGRFAFLEVRDTGCGMDQAIRSKIFDPFFTTKFQGRGLGLAAVSGIVRAQRGAIHLTTAPGAGSTFRVLLPAVGPTAAATAPEPPKKGDLHGKGTILVVDDEQVVRDLARRTLQQQGYEVLLAESGPAAMEIVRTRRGRVNLAVLDLSMPGMSGDETLPELRRLDPDLKVIVSSGFSEAETLEAFRGARVSGFLQKPYTVRQLAAEVKSAMA